MDMPANDARKTTRSGGFSPAHPSMQ